MLTVEEHLVAAERAANYPPGHGKLFLAIKPANDERQFMIADITAAWLRLHLEDVIKG